MLFYSEYEMSHSKYIKIEMAQYILPNHIMAKDSWANNFEEWQFTVLFLSNESYKNPLCLV